MAPRTPEQNEEIREQTRQQIKDAAFELFAKEGFSSTSVSKLAKKASVSKGLIYHYFSSKEEILVSLFEDMNKVGENLIQFSSDIPPDKRLGQILQGLFDYLENSSEVLRLLISLALQPDAIETVEPYVHEENERQVQVMTEIFSDLGYREPEEEAYYLAAKLDGIALGYISMGEDYPFEKIKQKILEEYVPDKKNG